MIDKGCGVDAKRALILGYIECMFNNAKSVTEVLNAVNEIENNQDYKDILFKRQGFSSSFFGKNELSNTGSNVYKLAKNRLLDLLFDQRIDKTNEEVEDGVKFLEKSRGRFNFSTTSAEIYKLFESKDQTKQEQARRDLKVEKIKANNWLSDHGKPTAEDNYLQYRFHR